MVERPAPEETVTSSFGHFIQGVRPQHLSPTVLQRSKRMVLDSLGVGLIGSTTEVFELALQHCQVRYCASTAAPLTGTGQKGVWFHLAGVV